MIQQTGQIINQLWVKLYIYSYLELYIEPGYMSRQITEKNSPGENVAYVVVCKMFRPLEDKLNTAEIKWTPSLVCNHCAAITMGNMGPGT